MARHRYEGDLANLTTVLKRHITDGRCILYAEDLKAPVERKTLQLHEPMLKELQQLQGNLSFKQSHMSTAMRIVGQHIGIGEEHLEVFARRGGGQAGSNPYVSLPPLKEMRMRMRVGMRMKMIMRMRRRRRKQ
eukprot:2637335-Amphidinium_carterae.1